jgi:hypothetical protein
MSNLPLFIKNIFRFIKKLYKKIFLILAVGASTSSCLDLDSQDQLSDGNMWQSASDFEYFANTFYGWTRDFKTVISDAPHSDWRSDLMTSSSINVYSHGNNSIETSDANYTDAYKHIRRTNLLLQKAEGYSGSETIAQYVAEAKFFRAYCYFDLLQLYGDAVITKSPLDIDSPELNAKRNNRSEVVDLIITDLQEAIPDLPETVSSEDDGRLTKWAANAFLSRIALYEGTWQKFRNNAERANSLLDIAAKAAKAVIDSNEFARSALLRNLCQVPSYNATRERKALAAHLVNRPSSSELTVSGRSGIASCKSVIIKSTTSLRLFLFAFNSGESISNGLFVITASP